MTARPLRAAIYARVSTSEQTVENQRLDLHRFIEARGWDLTKEYLDAGISGSKESRPALDVLLKDARRRRFDVLVVAKLDRLGRSLKHLVGLLDELQVLGIAFVSLGEGIDCTTPAGKLQMHILAAIAEFERGRIIERVRSGMARAKAQGQKFGRPCKRVTEADLDSVSTLSVRNAAAQLGISKSLVAKLRVSTKAA